MSEGLNEGVEHPGVHPLAPRLVHQAGLGDIHGRRRERRRDARDCARAEVRLVEKNGGEE